MLFRSHGDYILVKNGEGAKEEREDSKNLEYIHLLSSNSSENSLRVYLIKVSSKSHRKPISTNANELVYVLEGRLTYIIRKDEIALEKGDLLYFDGTVPHGLSNEFEETAVLLKIYLLN